MGHNAEHSTRKVPHRGASEDMRKFAVKFITARMAGFEKDIKICLTGVPSKTRSGLTHAYFPALGACCGTLEYLTALYIGRTNGIGWQQVSGWADEFLPQPAYDQDTVRVLFAAFRHSVAHRGIASGVWVDRNQGQDNGRRITWKVYADANKPACELVREDNELEKDPPWKCPITHRMHIHLRSLSVDLRNGAKEYRNRLRSDDLLVENFETCMRRLYPR